MSDPNTSASGGFLTPLPPPANPAPLQGKDLYRFIQVWIASITGLEGDLVRPAYQSENPNLPDQAVPWCSFTIHTRKGDTFPQIIHNGAGEGIDQLQNFESLAVLASFFDTGSFGDADLYATLLRDGAIIPQNREYLLRGGFDLGFTGELTPAPLVIKTVWQYRVDLPLLLKRQINRNYGVQNIESLEGTLYLSDAKGPDDEIVTDISVDKSFKPAS